jgi:hypothetical protein
VRAIDELAQVILRRRALLAGAAEAGGEPGRVEQASDRVRQRRRIAGRNRQGLDPVPRHGRNARRQRGVDDRQPRRHGLELRDAEGFGGGHRREDEDARRMHQHAQPLARDAAGQKHPVREPALLDQPPQPVRLDSVSHDDRGGIEIAERFDQHVESLV